MHKRTPSLTPSATFKKDSIDSDSTSSDNEFECKITDKLNILCFHANTAKKGFCVMALDDKKTGNNDDGDNSSSEV
jgi:hypothetical protein